MEWLVSVSTGSALTLRILATHPDGSSVVGNDYCRFGFVSVFHIHQRFDLCSPLDILIIAYCLGFVKSFFEIFYFFSVGLAVCLAPLTRLSYHRFQEKSIV